MKSARCRSCGGQIIWTKTEAGKNMPVDQVPVYNGNVILEPTDDPNVVKSYALPKGERKMWPRYKSHFATCPEAKSHRRKKT